MKIKMRSINTAFWSDPWVMDLDPIEKLLFLYLITNDKTNLAGIYELHPRRMAFETGIEKEMIEKILLRFQESDKVIYKSGWILICNFSKNQRLSPQMATNVQGILNELPDKIKTDTLYIPYIDPMHTLCRSIKKEEGSNEEGSNEEGSNENESETVTEKYNNLCDRMPKVIMISDLRKKVIKARIKEHSIEKVFEVFSIAGKSGFLNGGNDKGWTANFDWLMKPANFIKILEGNYDKQETKKAEQFVGENDELIYGDD